MSRIYKFKVEYMPTCKDCHLNFDGVCGGSFYGKNINDLVLCSDFKPAIRVFSNYLPQNFKVTSWGLVDNCLIFYGGFLKAD